MAKKTRCLLNDKANGEGKEVGCFNRMRVTLIGRVPEKMLSTRLTSVLTNDLDVIDKRLRVSTAHSAFAYAFGREFSEPSNYAKGHGKKFARWLNVHMPGIAKFPVPKIRGNRFDIIYSTAPAMMINHYACLTFLDYSLRLSATSGQQHSVLQRCLFCLLRSQEMGAQRRLLTIYYLAIMLPWRYVCGHSHKFAKYKWGVVHMGIVLDTVYTAMLEMEKSPRIVLQESS